MPLRIAPCTAADLDVLEMAIPSWGRSRFHHRRFDEHQCGAGVYLVAWDADVPVGHLNLRWMPGDPLPRRLAADCAEVNALTVFPAARRGQGIGSALMDEAEARAAAAGHARIGLAVDGENAAARRLYERRGYVEWGHGLVPSRWTWLDEHGNEQVVEEIDHYLIKVL